MKKPKKCPTEMRLRAREHLEYWQVYLMELPDYIQPKITATYSIELKNFNNQNYSSTESTVMRKIKYEEERAAFLQYVMDCVSGLRLLEDRQIIAEMYLREDPLTPEQMMARLNVGRTSLYRKIRRALYHLGLSLTLNSPLDNKEL